MPTTRSLAAPVYTILNGLWYVIAVSVVLVSLLFVWCLFFEVDTDKITMVLPIALDPDSIRGNGRDSRLVFEPIPQVRIERGRSGGRREPQIENVRANLRVPVHDTRYFSLNVGLVLVLVLFVWWIVTQLRGVVGSLKNGQPFDAANVRRIRAIGLAIIFGELVRAGATLFWSYSAALQIPETGFHLIPRLDVSLVAILNGLVVLVIAEAFREGARLREEQALTI